MENCFCCGIEMKDATADDPEELTMLYPEDALICPRCLKIKSRGIIKEE